MLTYKSFMNMLGVKKSVYHASMIFRGQDGIDAALQLNENLIRQLHLITSDSISPNHKVTYLLSYLILNLDLSSIVMNVRKINMESMDDSIIDYNNKRPSEVTFEDFHAIYEPAFLENHSNIPTVYYNYGI